MGTRNRHGNWWGLPYVSYDAGRNYKINTLKHAQLYLDSGNWQAVLTKPKFDDEIN